MEAKSCDRCLGWADSPKTVREILNNQFSACENCDRQELIRTVAEQYRMRVPRWWVVHGTVVVPIWIVELLKQNREF